MHRTQDNNSMMVMRLYASRANTDFRGNNMVGLLDSLANEAVILLTLSVILLAGFLLTRLTKLVWLPNVTGYIIAGVIIGPYALNIVPAETVKNFGFLSDIALAFIAFGVGRFFKKEVFKDTGVRIIVIALLESLIAGIFVTLALRYMFKLDWDFCLILGAIATATAPASTIITIRQYHARGNFVNVLLQVVALDDAVCLIVFSIAATIINSNVSSAMPLSDIIMPLLYNIIALGIGVLSGVVLSKLMTPSRSEDNRLILTIALLLGIAGLCVSVNISPLLSCMLFGMTYINMTKDKKLYRQTERFAPPILSIFFIVSGMSLDLSSFAGLGVIGICYFIVRIAGKYLGAFVGCAITKTSKTIRNYLGFALIPQAGVSIGLAFLGKRMLPAQYGNMLLTIILSSSVLYELIGPVSAKMALVNSGAINKEKHKR